MRGRGARSGGPGRGGGRSASVTGSPSRRIGTPFTRVWVMPVGRVGGEALAVGGEVVDPAQRAGRDGVGVEDGDVGGHALAQEAAAAVRAVEPEDAAGSPVSLFTARSSEITSRSRTQLPSRSVGRHASQSWLTCAPESARPSSTPSRPRSQAIASGSLLASDRAEPGLEVLVERDVEHHVERRARRARSRARRRCGRRARGARCSRRPRARPSSVGGTPCCSGRRCARDRHSESA